MASLKNLPSQKVKGFYILLFAKIFFLPLCLFVSVCGSAQTPDSSSRLSGSAISVYKKYAAVMGGGLGVYAGAEYEGALPNVSGNVFLREKDFQFGTVSYKGVLYPDIKMTYDLVRGEVVIKSFQQLSIRLERTSVDSFFLDGSWFIHIAAKQTSSQLPDAYYELLVNNPVRVYARRSKSIRKAFRADERDTLVSGAEYYIQNGNEYRVVSAEKDFQYLWGEKRSEIERFWEERRFRFKADPELFLLQTFSFWRQLRK